MILLLQKIENPVRSYTVLQLFHYY
jgi:hypothetical protein